MGRRAILLVFGLTAASALVTRYLFSARETLPKTLSLDDFAARYLLSLPAPSGPIKTYHLGHSLVGRDMPAMLAQLAQHEYSSQLGWGASLKNHWEGQVSGFAEENASSAFKAAGTSLDRGAYDAVILTEMVELQDAIRWHASAQYLAQWTLRARAGNPQVRVYLYETWHRLDDPAGWLARIDHDSTALWQDQLLRPAMADPAVGTIYVIPGGQVLGAVARAIDAGQVPGLTARTQVFAQQHDGTSDPIHLNDLGHYLMALTHYAVLYHKSPLGLPHQLRRADGRTADSFSIEQAHVLQQVVWQTVTRYRTSGVVQVR